ncbi:MAG: hypothetical protein F8N37_16415 [Telmatospirillum sp.]|nr:hypothetical protein [Telmatospirillum sp.]
MVMRNEDSAPAEGSGAPAPAHGGVAGSASVASGPASLRAERVAAAWEAKRRNAGVRPLTARAPAWLRLAADGRGFELIPDRVAVVRRIFAESGRGIGANAIARQLNDDSVPPFGKSSGWQESYVKKILANEAVTGVLQPHSCRGGRRRPEGPPIAGYYPAVIDADQFARTRESVRSRFVGGGGTRRKTFANLFAGLAFCSICGGPIRHFDKGGPRRQWLQCDNARRHAGCDNLSRWPYSALEDDIIALFREGDIACLPADLDPTATAGLPDDQRLTLREDLVRWLNLQIDRITFFPLDIAALVLAGRRDIRLVTLRSSPTRGEPGRNIFCAL